MPSLKLIVERRLMPSRTVTLAVPALSVVLALLSSALLFAVARADPLFAYGKILGVFMDIQGLSEAATRATPLLLMAAGLALAFKMGFWNIGAEGQLYMGAFAATGIVLTMGDLPSALLILAMALASFAAGGAWGSIAAALKARLQVNEVLTTLMMNFIAIYWVAYLVYGPWRDPAGYGFPLTRMYPAAARLPNLPGLRIHLGFLLAILVAVGIYALLSKTRLGYEVKVVGQSLKAAQYGGISYPKVLLIVMALSGGLAGLAGMAITAGILYRLRPFFSPGYGYMAIIIAWLSRLNPLASIAASFLFGGLLVAGDTLQLALGLPVPVVLAFQALILIFLLAGEALYYYRISLRWA